MLRMRGKWNTYVVLGRAGRLEQPAKEDNMANRTEKLEVLAKKCTTIGGQGRRLSLMLRHAKGAAGRIDRYDSLELGDVPPETAEAIGAMREEDVAAAEQELRKAIRVGRELRKLVKETLEALPTVLDDEPASE